MTPQPLNSAAALGPVEGRGVAEIRALCDAATPGPWEATANHRILPPPPQLASHSLPRNLDPVAEASSAGNAEFIAAARDLVPQLLAEVEAAHRFERSAAVEREALLVEVDRLEHLVETMVAAANANGRAVQQIRELRGCLGAGPMDYEAFVDEIDRALAAAADAPQPADQLREDLSYDRAGDNNAHLFEPSEVCDVHEPGRCDLCRCGRGRFAPLHEMAEVAVGPSPAVLPEKEPKEQPDV